MEKIYISQPGEPLEDGTPTVYVAEAEITSKARYTLAQLQEKRSALLAEIRGINEVIAKMENADNGPILSADRSVEIDFRDGA